MDNQEKAQVYESLTNSKENKIIKEKWTINLFMCALAASIACFLFGFNLGSLSIMKPFIIQFYETNYFPSYSEQKITVDLVKKEILFLMEDYEKSETNFSIMSSIFHEEEYIYLSREKETKEKYNITEYPIFPRAKKKIDLKRQHINNLKIQLDLYKEIVHANVTKFNETVKNLNDEMSFIDMAVALIWSLTILILTIGICIGAILSKYIADEIGRRNGLLFHYLLSLFSSFFIFSLHFIDVQYISSAFIKISVFINGFQAGIGFSLVFLYLNEISPIRIRGEVGMIAPIEFILGIIVSQILGFNYILGNGQSWTISLSLPALIASVGIIVLACFPESPKTLILERNNLLDANKALRRLRNTRSVSCYINEILEERGSNSSILFEPTIVTPYVKHLKKCWFFSFMLHVSVQSSGIYPMIYYAKEIFESFGFSKNSSQYVEFVLGIICLVTFITTAILIDKCIGRKTLLILSIIFIIADLIIFNIFMTLRETDPIFNYFCFGCIVIFMISFSFGIGPIPFIYICECFKHESRSSAIAFSVFTNGMTGSIIFITFSVVKNVVGFHMITGLLFVLTLTLIFSLFRMPETRQRSIKEIKSKFQELSVYRF